MALGILNILYMILIIIAVVVQVLLYKDKDESKNSIYIINMLFGIILAYLAYTSLPTNFTSQKIIALVFGIIPILAVILKSRDKSFITISKVMLSLSIIVGIVQLFS